VDQQALIAGARDGDQAAFTALVQRHQETQPFAVATPFTGRPGQVVPVAATLHGFKALLAGEYDDLPEEAFAWRGALPVV
jgi:F0F1-type ATP synthase beta subunit